MTWHSQAGQDEWVHSIVGDSGYFVDVGAHDGVVHSNTYALEQLGWTGLCIEPQEGPWRELASRRSVANGGRSACVIGAASDHAGSGWIAGDHLLLDVAGDVPVFRLDWLLPNFAVPPAIDYLSIDVEGHELQVLAGMDFDRWHVRCITIEHNLYSDGPGRKNAIFGVLTGHGFKRAREDVIAEGYGPYEDWYQS